MQRNDASPHMFCHLEVSFDPGSDLTYYDVLTQVESIERSVADLGARMIDTYRRDTVACFVLQIRYDENDIGLRTIVKTEITRRFPAVEDVKFTCLID